MPNPTQLMRSVLTFGLAQMLSWVGAAALAVLLPRYLGDVNLGKFAFAFAFTQLVGLVADLGTATYLAKEIARDRTQAASLVANALTMRVPLSLAAAAVAVAGVHLAGYDEITRQLVYILCLGIVLNAVGNVMFGALQGFQQMKALAGFSLATKLGYAALVAAFLLGGAGPVEVGIAWVVSLMFGLAVAGLALRRLIRLTPSVHWRAWHSILLGGLPFFVWQAALMVYGQVDAVELSLLTHDAVVGWYAAAYRIVTIPIFLPTIIMTVVFPALSATSSSPAAFNAIARRSLHAVALLCIPMALGIMLLSDKLIGLLSYPDSFTNSIIPIVLLAVHIPLVGMDMVIGTVLNTRDRQKQWAMTAIAAAVLNPLLNIVAIGFTQTVYNNGAIGAAFTTTLTEVFMLTVGLRLLPHGVFDRTTAISVLKCATAGLSMAIAVWTVRDLPLVAPVLVGALVYGASAVVLGAVSLNDLRLVRLHLAQRRAASAATT